MLITILILISSVSFFGYGLNCLFSEKMKREFNRFGLAKFRILTGVLQLLGASSLVIGFKIPLFTIIGSIGLTALMLLGFMVRLKIKDSIIQSTPAFLFMLLNIYIALNTFI